MTIRRPLLLAAAAVLLAGAGITAADAAAAGHTVSIGNCTTEGEFVSCSVQGDISHPATISVQVWASPAQSISVFWGDSCSNDSSGTFGDRNGNFTVTGGSGHKVARRIPLAAGHSGSCTPDVDVSLQGTGRIHVLLSGQH